jgi:hypothetical protein
MRSRPLIILVVPLLALVLPAAPAHAGGVVSVCDEAHLRTALTGGGTVTFSCVGYITLANTAIDGSGQTVTISGGNDAVCAAAPISGLDRRGVARPQGAHCDIGAVEQHSYSAANVIKVPNDYATIQEPIDAAAEEDEIWVVWGNYTVTLSIAKGISLVGGWEKDFSLRVAGTSVISADGMGRAISIALPISTTVVTIDGFTLRDGDATGLGMPNLPETPAGRAGSAGAKAAPAVGWPWIRAPTPWCGTTRWRATRPTPPGPPRTAWAAA